MGDGWLPNYRTAESAADVLAKLDGFLEQNGRSRADIGLEARLHWGAGNLDELGETMSGWEAAGATHISLNTMGAGFDTPQAHLAAVRAFADAHLAG